MLTKEIEFFDLRQICNSGQCFRMRETGENRFSVMAGGRYLEAGQEGKQVWFRCSQEEFENFWKGYFDLEQDYGVYRAAVNPNDKYLKTAAELGFGIRILRQDVWEMIISFLISQQNHIARIRRCIENICREYGEKKTGESGREYYGFPSPEALALASEEDLLSCNLGYRAKYVIQSAKSVAGGEIDLEKLPELSFKKAKEELRRLYGVGEKVADCICLFGLHKMEAFPVDTHIRQALDAHYKRGFPQRRYKGMQGIMQQYIFYYELMKPSLRRS